MRVNIIKKLINQKEQEFIYKLILDRLEKRYL
jgi:hypothetical protein